MIQDFIRRHKPMMLIVVLAVVVPFIFSVGYFGLGMGGPGGDGVQALGPVAVVEGQPIPAALFSQTVTDEINQRRRMGADPEPEDLVEDGTGMELVEDLVNRVILEIEAADTQLTFDDAFLQEQLRDAPDFQTDGQFDPAKWNAFLERNRDMNWNSQYEALARQLRLQVFQQQAIASARVLDSEVRRRFEENHTQLQVRYAAISPKVELTEEDLREYYEDNIDAYQDPAQYKAAFVAVSLDAPEPPLARELVERARAGEDFAALAREHSNGPYRDEGGAFDWRTVQPDPPAHLETLYTTPTGDVSDPVRGPNGFYIYTVEARETDEETGEERVKGRQIFLRTELPPLEREARVVQAERIAEQASAESMEAAADAAGLPLETTDYFSEQSLTIENVPSRDAWPFRRAVAQLPAGGVSDVIEGTENLYVAHLLEVVAPEPKPFEDVREQVREDAVAARKRTLDYQARLEEIAAQLEEVPLASLDELSGRLPDAEVQTGAAPPFTVDGYRPSATGAVWNARDVFEAVGYERPGAVNGPVYGLVGGFGGDPALFYVELLGKTPPSEEVWEQFDEQREDIRRQIATEKQRQRYEDFMLAQRNRHAWQLNVPVYEELLGLNDEADEVETDDDAASDEAGQEDAAAADDGAAADADDETPAE